MYMSTYSPAAISLGTYEGSRDDLAAYAALKHLPVPAEFVNISRWHSHIVALIGPSFCGGAVGVHIESEAAASAVPTSSRDLAPVAVPETTPAAATAEATPAPKADDDDLDLFGEETEEEAAAAAEREASKKAAGAKKKEKVCGVFAMRLYTSFEDTVCEEVRGV
ncbi:unnamed protein product [Sphagnum balticum]